MTKHQKMLVDVMRAWQGVDYKLMPTPCEQPCSRHPSYESPVIVGMDDDALVYFLP